MAALLSKGTANGLLGFLPPYSSVNQKVSFPLPTFARARLSSETSARRQTIASLRRLFVAAHDIQSPWWWVDIGAAPFPSLSLSSDWMPRAFIPDAFVPYLHAPPLGSDPHTSCLDMPQPQTPTFSSQGVNKCILQTILITRVSVVQWYQTCGWGFVNFLFLFIENIELEKISNLLKIIMPETILLLHVDVNNPRDVTSYDEAYWRTTKMIQDRCLVLKQKAQRSILFNPLFDQVSATTSVSEPLRG